MTLKERITEDMKAAMRASEKERLSTIRMVQAAIKQREVDERITLDDAQVIAGGELRHDAPVGRVQVHLAVQLVRDQASVAVVDRRRRFVAGSLQAEDPHVLQFQPTLSKIRGPFPGSSTTGSRPGPAHQTDNRGFDAQRSRS